MFEKHTKKRPIAQQRKEAMILLKLGWTREDVARRFKVTVNTVYVWGYKLKEEG